MGRGGTWNAQARHAARNGGLEFRPAPISMKGTKPRAGRFRGVKACPVGSASAGRGTSLRVGPRRLLDEPGAVGQVVERLGGVLVRILGVDRLALGEDDRQAARGDVDGLVGLADEVHLDPAQVGAVDRAVVGTGRGRSRRRARG